MLDEEIQEVLGVKMVDGYATRNNQPAPGKVKGKTERVRKSGTVLSGIMGAADNGIPGDLLEKAHAIAIIPQVIKGAMGIGGRFGVICHQVRINPATRAPDFLYY